MVTERAQSHAEFAAELRSVATFIEKHTELPIPTGAEIYHFDYVHRASAQLLVNAAAEAEVSICQKDREKFLIEFGASVAIFGFMDTSTLIKSTTRTETVDYVLPTPTVAEVEA